MNACWNHRRTACWFQVNMHMAIQSLARVDEQGCVEDIIHDFTQLNWNWEQKCCIIFEGRTTLSKWCEYADDLVIPQNSFPQIRTASKQYEAILHFNILPQTEFKNSGCGEAKCVKNSFLMFFWKIPLTHSATLNTVSLCHYISRSCRYSHNYWFRISNS